MNPREMYILLVASAVIIVKAQTSVRNTTLDDVRSGIPLGSTESWSSLWVTSECSDCGQEIHSLTTPYSAVGQQFANSSPKEEIENTSSMTLINGSVSTTLPPTWIWLPITWNWWVILQMVAALLGIVGNLLVIILLFQRRKKSRSTDTLVGALATADFFTSVFLIPLPIGVRVPFSFLGQVYCKLIFTSMLMWMSVVASVLTLTFIPIERYIAVVYPFRCKELLSRRRVVSVIISFWCIGFVLNSFLLFITWVHPTEKRCNLAFPWGGMQQTVGVFIFTIEFFIPALISLSLHGLTARALHQQSQVHLSEDKVVDQKNPTVRHAMAKKRVLQTLFIVIVLFVVCWGPNQTVYLAFNLRLVPQSYIFSPLYHSLNILGFCNSCANPIVYTVRYPEFRQAMWAMFNPSKMSDIPLFGDRPAERVPPTDRK